jgi:hypothetical protein
MSKVQKLMKRYVKVVAIQAALQFTIIFIMAGFATGLAFIYKNKVSVLATMMIQKFHQISDIFINFIYQNEFRKKVKFEYSYFFKTYY